MFLQGDFVFFLVRLVILVCLKSYRLLEYVGTCVHNRGVCARNSGSSLQRSS